jgi:DNA-binding NarL/FixJ family response regulator
VLVIDDHRTFAELMALALGAEPDLRCVGVAHTVEDGVRRFRELRPDLVVLDFRFPESDKTGMDATRTILAIDPTARVVMLTGHPEPRMLRDAANAGVYSLLPKDGALTDLLAVLRGPRQTGFVVHPAMVRSLLGAEEVQPDGLPHLTNREQEVLDMLLIGLDARAIANQLGISLNTSRAHLKSLLAKFHAHSQLELVAMARRRGLVDGRQER